MSNILVNLNNIQIFADNNIRWFNSYEKVRTKYHHKEKGEKGDEKVQSYKIGIHWNAGDWKRRQIYSAI